MRDGTRELALIIPTALAEYWNRFTLSSVAEKPASIIKAEAETGNPETAFNYGIRYKFASLLKIFIHSLNERTSRRPVLRIRSWATARTAQTALWIAYCLLYFNK